MVANPNRVKAQAIGLLGDGLDSLDNMLAGKRANMGQHNTKFHDPSLLLPTEWYALRDGKHSPISVLPLFMQKAKVCHKQKPAGILASVCSRAIDRAAQADMFTPVATTWQDVKRKA
jgi:hypothetical protein